ncbi:hypothetical protein [Cellulomonas sp. URHD0024]|uniref:hypothetical protein n=1 Tax=Cellulomonas sp. URHD0024 TaxID=1302620 RepID=UPI0018CB896F|nr:hypothetical protein [Cellulomonas sp. URHD0024]
MTDDVDQHPLRRAGRWLARERQIDEFLYGALVSGSVFAVSSAKSEDGGSVLLATGLVNITYWLAHVYVDLVGGRFHDHERSTGHRFRHALQSSTGVLLGSVPSMVLFSACRLFGLDVATAAWTTLWFTVALLGYAGGLAAHRAGARRWPLIGETAIALGFGMAVILLKIILH